jgi:ribosome recycling factor
MISGTDVSHINPNPKQINTKSRSAQLAAAMMQHPISKAYRRSCSACDITSNNILTMRTIISLLLLSAATHSFLPLLPPRPQLHHPFTLHATPLQDITANVDDRMIKSVDNVKVNLMTIRTGRASAQMLDRVMVDYYGAATPLKQLASISVPSAQQLTVDPYDKKALGDIEKAIVEAELGLTPNNDGSIIRINIPPLTEDRRKEMLKQCKAIGEEGKVAVRNIRRDGTEKVKKLEKDGVIGQDEMKDGFDVLQKSTDLRVKEITEIVDKKEKDVMKV